MANDIGNNKDYEAKGTTYQIPVDSELADGPKAFAEFADSIPFSEYVSIVEVSSDTTVDDSYNGKMIVATESVTLTFGTLKAGFSVAAVAEADKTIEYVGVDKVDEKTTAYEVATVVSVGGTNILNVAGEASSAGCPDCPDCPDCPEPELPGLGGWATITAVSGVYTPHRYNDGPSGVGGTDWVAYEWTDDGELTTTEGLAEVLVVGGGSAGTGGGTSYIGGGGDIANGLHPLTKTAHTVTVGTVTPSPGGSDPHRHKGKNSLLGTILGAGGDVFTYGQGHLRGLNTSGHPYGDGMPSSITGSTKYYGASGHFDKNSSQYYGAGYGEANSGSGGTTNASGQAGVVIVRVPAAYADNVQETFHGWLNFATVENGVVTKVTKTPDNQPYKAAADEVECDASVQEGYLYENGEFTAPKPDYSEQVKQLEEQLAALKTTAEQDTMIIDGKEQPVKRRRRK